MFLFSQNLTKANEVDTNGNTAIDFNDSLIMMAKKI